MESDMNTKDKLYYINRMADAIRLSLRKSQFRDCHQLDRFADAIGVLASAPNSLIDSSRWTIDDILKEADMIIFDFKVEMENEKNNGSSRDTRKNRT
jgi:hypothetical protein